MRPLIALVFVVLLSACGAKQEMEVADVPNIDSIVNAQPVATGAPIVLDSNSGLMIDQTRMRTPEHIQTLSRFKEVEDITHVYREFRPLRKKGLSQTSLDSFLRAQKITMKELQAVLSEGDQLGWNTVDASGKPIR